MTAVASLAAALAALAAVATAGFVVWQVREDGRRARFNAGVESVWHLSEQWNSPAMLDVRSAAASALLSGKPTPDVDAVLEFFDELALFTRRGAIDEELAALEFYWPMAVYWSASRDYVHKAQHDPPSTWDNVGGLLTQFTAIEARRRQRQPADLLPSDDQMQRFLVDEKGQDECADDSEAERTPL